MKTQKSVALLILFFSGVDLFGAQNKLADMPKMSMPKTSMSKQSVAKVDESAECNCRPKPKPGSKDMGPVEHTADCACNKPKPIPQAQPRTGMEMVDQSADCACNKPKPKPQAQPRTSVEPVSESADCGCSKPKPCSKPCSKPCCKDMPMVDEASDCKECTVVKPQNGNKVTVRFRTRKPGAQAQTQSGVSVSRKK